MLATLLLLALPALAVDLDGDGYEADDCDDTDPLVNPAGDEGTVADGIDQDCTGIADDRAVCTGPGDWLQQAIDDAPDGFTLALCAGNHKQRAEVVGKNLVLAGAGAGATALNGEDLGNVLKVRSGAEVTVKDLTMLRGAGNGRGGALRCSSSAVTLQGVRVLNSSATDGGGVSALGCAVTVQDSQFRDNVASGDGGGIWADSGSVLAIEGSYFRDGQADEGGGVWADGAVLIEGTTFRGNDATSTANDYVGGGGVWLGGSGTVTGSTFVDNHADMCGGGFYAKWFDGDVVGNVFAANQADDDGGGVYFDWSTATFQANTVLENDAIDDAGGLRIYYGEMVIEDNLIQGNTANDDGGGVKMSHAEHTYRRNVHRRNSTGDAGGGLELDNDDSNVEDCVFEENVAGRGGGLHSWRNESTFAVTNSDFSGNRATDCGGAMAFDNDTHRVTLRHLDLFDNTSDDDGGALCTQYREQDSGLAEESDILLVQSTALGNGADDEGGFAKVSYGSLLVQNSLLIANTAAQGTQGLADEDGMLRLHNTIVLGGSGGSILDEEAGGVVDVAYSLFFAGTGGFGAVGSPVGSNGNLAVDPMVDLSDDGRLLPGSPAIDAGDPAILDDDGSVSDMGRYGGPGAE